MPHTLCSIGPAFHICIDIQLVPTSKSFLISPYYENTNPNLFLYYSHILYYRLVWAQNPSKIYRDTIQPREIEI